MENRFGDIPEEVLSIELKEFETEYKTLAQMIDESVSEPIVESKYVISAGNFGLDLINFHAWTKSHVLQLKQTPFGYYMIVSDRNPQ